MLARSLVGVLEKHYHHYTHTHNQTSRPVLPGFARLSTEANASPPVPPGMLDGL